MPADGPCRPALVHRVRPHALVDLVSLDPGEGGEGPVCTRLPGVPAGTRGDIHVLRGGVVNRGGAPEHWPADPPELAVHWHVFALDDGHAASVEQ